MIVSVLGLGEAGKEIASGLLTKGFIVTGFDIRKVSIPGVEVSPDIASAVNNADFIFSVNSATVATKVLKDTAPHMKSGAIFIDLNTGSPGLKRQLSEILGNKSFVDGAMMLPVSGLGADVPIIVAGPSAETFTKIMSESGLNVKNVGEQVGDAAIRELIKSVLSKGIASVVIETLWAAQALGLEEWAIEEIRNEFDNSSRQSVQRYLDDMQKHAKRKQVEMGDVISMFNEVGYDSAMTAPIELILSKIIHSKRIPFAQKDD